MTRYILGAHLLREAMWKSLAGLCVPVFFYLLMCTVCGSLVVAFEASLAASEGAPSAVYNETPSVAAATPPPADVFTTWLELATLTTVGWVSPDFRPQSVGARLVVTAAAMLGLLVIALALSIVGGNFGEVWHHRTVHAVRLGLRQLMTSNDISLNDVFTAFSRSDIDSCAPASQNLDPAPRARMRLRYSCLLYTSPSPRDS